MSFLSSGDRPYLRAMAHHLKPVVIIGRNGLAETVHQTIDLALKTHELIKIKFNDFKEKKEKDQLSSEIEGRLGCEQVGQVGHIAIFYRPHPEPEKRRISLPSRG